MLFYEPLFLTVFPAFYALYLLARGTSAKKWALLIASALFYLWGEPGRRRDADPAALDPHQQ